MVKGVDDDEDKNEKDGGMKFTVLKGKTADEEEKVESGKQKRDQGKRQKGSNNKDGKETKRKYEKWKQRNTRRSLTL